MSSAAALLEKLLRGRIDLAHVHRRIFKSGEAIADTIVPTARLLLACGGSAQYAIEGAAFRFQRGDMLLILPRTRRNWSVRGPKGFTLWWAEFEASAALTGQSHFLASECSLSLEQASLRRLAQLCALGSPLAALQAEGEFKALLARFLARADTRGEQVNGPARRSSGERAVIDASAWLGAHFQEFDALAQMQRQIDLSPNHFRLLFRRHFGCSAQHYLTALRMRAARALLRETVLPVKEIARSVGCRDPLFFSRAYAAYWKRSPVKDRAFSP